MSAITLKKWHIGIALVAVAVVAAVAYRTLWAGGGSAGGRLPDEALHPGHVLFDAPPERALESGDREELAHAGCCWLMQWNAPPPARRSFAGTPTARRVGKSCPTRRSAASSAATPYCGTTTVVLAT